MVNKKIEKPSKNLTKSKIIILGLALTVIVFVVATTVLAVQVSKLQAEIDTDKDSSLETQATKHSTSPSPSSNASPPPSTAPSPSSSPIKPNTAPFRISGVYFSRAPALVAGQQAAGWQQCTVGQVVKYDAWVDITATNAGTATYYWEVASSFNSDPTLNGNTKYDKETITFAAAGTKTIQKTFSYTVLNENGNKNTRQYVNAFFTSPNVIYANQVAQAQIPAEGPGFVWGSYIDFC